MILPGQLKKWLKTLSPFALSKNHYYDRLTKKIIYRHCKAASNCIDVGCHEGEMLALFLSTSPDGTHFAFEPLPFFFGKLVSRYKGFANCHLYNYALSYSDGMTTFNHVITNPAYSGIKKRKYDRNNEKDETITVIKKRLDDVIPEGTKIDFIKIDTEGGDLDVLKGAEKTIRTHQPLVVFEFGIGGSDIYGATPEMLYEFMHAVGYRILLLSAWLKNKPPLSLQEFSGQFYGKKNYYFIASPGNKITLQNEV